MFAEIIQLNKIYKTNCFTNIKPSVYQDAVIYNVHSNEGKKAAPKLACTMHRVEEAEFDTKGILSYFGVSFDAKEIIDKSFNSKMQSSKQTSEFHQL